MSGETDAQFAMVPVCSNWFFSADQTGRFRGILNQPGTFHDDSTRDVPVVRF